MCGRFVSSSPPDVLAAYFGVDQVGETLQEARYNVAPTTEVPVVVERDDHRRLDTFRWGLVPTWANDLRIGNKMINARAETLATKNAFRSAFRKRRCIVCADGFYEWARLDGSDTKTPFFIHRADGAPLAFAGLWERWRDPDPTDDPEANRWIETCTIITGSPNERIAKIHDRMPVMLHPDSWDRWLDPTFHDTEALEAFFQPAPASDLVLHPVSTAVNNVRSQGPGLIEPVAAEASGDLDRSDSDLFGAEGSGG
jgi:putative SOS response-associated peptidase YedK